MITPRPRRGRLAGVAAGLVAGLVAPLALAAPPAAASRSGDYEREVLRLVNVHRVAKDLPRLRLGWCADRYAESWTRHMAATGELEHQDLGRVLRGCDRTRAAENIAHGYPSAKAVVSAWMHSPGHRRNILDRRLRTIGVAAVQDGRGTWWAGQVFTD